jgi:hypothetical protein
MPSEYAKSLGARLRSIRQQQGLSLQGVEEKSAGRWKAVVVGSYDPTWLMIGDLGRVDVP